MELREGHTDKGTTVAATKLCMPGHSHASYSVFMKSSHWVTYISVFENDFGYEHTEKQQQTNGP